jgi:hypothetical protein
MQSMTIPPPSSSRPAIVQRSRTDAIIPIADERIEIEAPSYKLKVAEDNEVSIRVLFPGLTMLVTDQTQYAGGKLTEPRSAPGTEQQPAILERAGKTYIEVKPMQLGEVELSIVAKFSDGAIARKKVMLSVGLPDRRPCALIVADNEPPRTNSRLIEAHLEDDTESWASKHAWISVLTVGASYEGTKYPVVIDPSHASFRVKSAGGPPVIRVDSSTGKIFPIRLGHALVETTFEGLTNRTCVIVEPGNASTSNPSVCNDLLLPGEKLSFDEALRSPHQ